ncbi:MAG: hypothetical protein LBS77_07285 [Desulfovibrio sp.]|nr:hypothetical protein [Desulfovibrio sp.]
MQKLPDGVLKGDEHPALAQGHTYSSGGSTPTARACSHMSRYNSEGFWPPVDSLGKSRDKKDIGLPANWVNVRQGNVLISPSGKRILIHNTLSYAENTKRIYPRNNQFNKNVLRSGISTSFLFPCISRRDAKFSGLYLNFIRLPYD